MVSHSANSLRMAPEPTNRSSEILVEFPLPASGNERLSILGAEDQVLMKARVSRRHDGTGGIMHRPH